MSTGDRNNFGPEQAKITTPTSNNSTQLRKYLRGLPSLDFSEKGCANICQRFGVSANELHAAVTALQNPRPNAPTAKLLRTIGAVVGSTSEARGGASRC